ncbi:Alpha/Beta hydrolase protein [Boletus edulis BED1]|uniref:Alpha/Beta hydrolase protein n=1 Tax=Boletus edulis BED1 TaxID=1328754 RepID=A0AAD4GJQ8_BOLED|nr:Alpha/Beta hydrolase protein [Boletus edulis BED1]
MPLTEGQRKALLELRAQASGGVNPIGSSMPFDKRAHLPMTNIPDDIRARVEIAPPLSTPFPLLDHSALKKPERVPIFYYSLRSEDHTQCAPEDTKVVFYIHGGGNISGHPADVQYTTLLAAILRALATGKGNSVPCIIVAPCYRLSTIPDNTFPAALQDILAAYDFVIGQGYKAFNITIAGDSAGGNHAVVLTHLALQSNRPSPVGVIAFAPASIQSYDNLSEHAKAQADNDLRPLSRYQRASSAYIGNTDFAPTDPLISGSFIAFTASWPRTLILVGTGDQLIDGSRELEKRLAALKRPVELVEYDECPHLWWLAMSIFTEEIRDAVQRVARFVLG